MDEPLEVGDDVLGAADETLGEGADTGLGFFPHERTSGSQTSSTTRFRVLLLSPKL